MLEEYFAKARRRKSPPLIVEGIQGVGGINEASARPLPTVTISELARKHHGAIFVANGIQCGIWPEAGKVLFATIMPGVDADIYTMAKGMGNGFTVAGDYHRATATG